MKELICSECLYVGLPKMVKQGSQTIDTICWCIFPLGLPYNLWRIFNKKQVCRLCENESLVDLNSILGQKLSERYVNKAMGIETNDSVKAPAENTQIPAVKTQIKYTKSSEPVPAPPASIRRDPSIPYVDENKW